MPPVVSSLTPIYVGFVLLLVSTGVQILTAHFGLTRMTEEDCASYVY